MSDVIQMVAAKTGLDAGMIEKGYGVILTGLRKFAPDLYDKVATHLPESGKMEAAYAASNKDDSGGGMLGNLAGIAANAMGGDASRSLGMMQMFGRAGFSAEQVKKFLPPALEHLNAVVPQDVVAQIYDRIPGLKELS